MLLIDLGRDMEASEELRKVLYLDPSLAAAHFALGMIRKRRGDGAGARRAFRNVRRMLSQLPPEQKLPLARGETAGRLGELAQGELDLLEEGR
jgi:Flp pilus assembly protein TadD